MPTDTKLNPLNEPRAELRDLQHDLDTMADQIEAAQRAGAADRWMGLLAHERELPGLIRQARRTLLPLELAAAWQAAEQCHDRETQLAADLTVRRAELRDARDHAKRIMARSTPPVERAEHGVVVQIACDAEQTTRRAHEDALDATCLALVRVEELENEIADLTGGRPTDEEGFRARPLPATGNMRLYTAGELGPLAELLLDESSALRHWKLPVGAVPPRALAHRFNHSHSEPVREGPSDHELAIQRRAAEHQQRMAELPVPSNGWVPRQMQQKEMNRNR